MGVGRSPNVEVGPGLVIRRARGSDANPVAPMIAELAGDGVTNTDAARRFRRVVRAPSYSCYVLEQAETVVGVWVGRSGYLFATEAPAIQPVALVVSPEHRGQGFGGLLMHNCPFGNRHSQNWFVTQHDHLHDYYQDLGWSPTGVRFVRHTEQRPQRSILERAANKLLTR